MKGRIVAPAALPGAVGHGDELVGGVAGGQEDVEPLLRDVAADEEGDEALLR